MIKRVTHAAIYVRDVAEARDWYTGKLGFVVRSDTPMGETDRWITVGPADQPDFEILMQPTHWGADALGAAEREAVIGKESGLIFETGDVRGLVEALKGKGVEFTMDITEYPWGTQTAFKDLYGNVHVVS
jgi:catechol 2,3-dioxygenase-like lactoylglutathione lyase family enzyme